MSKITLVENDPKSLSLPLEVEMKKSIKHFEAELLKIRTGRAHTNLVEDILVSVYGQQPMPLKQIAALTAADARLITIQPWDTGVLEAIEKAIANSDVGLTPINDGKIIRLQLPEMSTTRRDELAKLLSKKEEECKVSIRNVRKDFNNLIRDAKKDKTISENFFNRLEDTLQKVTDAFIEQASQLTLKKEKEIRSV